MTSTRTERKLDVSEGRIHFVRTDRQYKLEYDAELLTVVFWIPEIWKIYDYSVLCREPTFPLEWFIESAWVGVRKTITPILKSIDRNRRKKVA